MRTRFWGRAAITAALIAVAPAFAFRYSTYVGTTVYGYNTPAAADANHAETYTPLRFRLEQDTGGGNVALIANGRFYKDVAASGDGNGRVYYGYLRWRSPREWVEVDAGRQYIAAGTAATYLDGGRVIVKQGRKWVADFYGGATVAPDFGPPRRLSPLSPQEEQNRPGDRGYWRDSSVFGVHAGTNIKELWSAMAFPVWVGGGATFSRRGGLPANRLLGAEAVEDPHPRLKLSQEGQYDDIGGRFAYQYYSVRYRPTDRFNTYADYRWQQPRIDYASLFWVFAHEGRSRARIGGQYKFSDKVQPFADYALTRRGVNQGNRVRAGVDHDFGYTFLEYGGVYGAGGRAVPGGDERGAFASARFPRPFPSFEPLSLATSVDYLEYKPYAPDAAWENVLLYDLHGTLDLWKYLEVTLGGEYLRNADRASSVRAYAQAGFTISR